MFVLFLDEPNDNNPGGEDCLTLMYRRNELNDIHCTFKSKGYVCEKDSKLQKCRRSNKILLIYINHNLNGSCQFLSLIR